MIPLIQREAVEKHGWADDDELTEIVAVAESTPGPIAINAATFVGYRAGGLAGAAVATLGVVLSAFFIILALSFALREFQSLPLVRAAFTGIRAGVLALIVRAAWLMYDQCRGTRFCAAVAVGALAASALFGVGTIPILLICAAAGLARSLILAGRAEK